MYDIIIIGAGAAGLAAAASAHDSKLSLLLIEKEPHLGGILNQCIHTGFGLEVFQEELTGPEYAHRFVENLPSQIEILLATTVLDIKKDVYFELKVSNMQSGFQTLQSKAIIITSGCYERTRGAIELPGERPKGVMTAGSAQRYLNIDGFLVGKKIFIVGSGDIGLIMARRMTLEGAQVLGVAEIMPYSNGLNRNIVQCLHDFDIPLFLSHKVVDVQGKDSLQQISIQEVDNQYNGIPGTLKAFDVDALLLSVGLIPDIALFDSIHPVIDRVTRSMVVDQHYESSIPGLFIAGNALHVHDLVDYVTLESQKAGLFARHFVEGHFQEKRCVPLQKTGLVRYLVPQIIDTANINGDVEVLLRVVKPLPQAILRITTPSNNLQTKRLMHLMPAEMMKVVLKQEWLGTEEPITIDIEEVIA